MTCADQQPTAAAAPQMAKARLVNMEARGGGQAFVAADKGGGLAAMSAAESMGLPYLKSLGDHPVSQDFVKRIPIAFARRHGLVGLAGDNGTMSVAICGLEIWPQLHVVAKVLGKRVKPVFAPREEILRIVNFAYQQQSGQAQKLIEQLDETEVMRELDQAIHNEDLLDVASKAPVIKLVNLVLLEAVKRRASDVHVQPHEEELVVRFRVDGVLYDVFHPPKALQEEVISRIKVMGGMNIAERRLAQDGRATVEVGDRIVDLRIATLPTSFGERAVIRLLDKSARQYELTDLGMPEGVLRGFQKLIRMDHGIILVTGPTGSGKSTTLYASLAEINSQEMNILTLEDPIEYRLDGISQTQVSDRKGMTFASGLRHVLRQDPDIIMVGEIRDADTAHMAIQSALTGHLVFSTLHTNDAAGAVARMLDLGVEPYLLASSLLGVLAQRLVRRICPTCCEPYQPTDAEFEHWGAGLDRRAIGQFHRGRGCPECTGTGFRERVGTFELLTASETIRELILRRAKASSIKDAAVANGMKSLRDDGIEKVAQGLTTMDEVIRVTGLEGF
ncbi:MAG: type II secretion system ATPase GspE [Phycisphaerae bacterium]